MWTPEAWSMAKPSPVKTTRSSRTVTVTKPLGRGRVSLARVPVRRGSPALRQGRVLEEHGRFMGVRSFDVELEADAGEPGFGIVRPGRASRVLQDRLGRSAVDPPPQDV